MGEAHGRSGAHTLMVLGVALISLFVAGCREQEDDTTQENQETGPDTGSFAACLPWYENDVESLAVSADGSRWLYLSGRKPTGLPSDASWRSDDLAIFVRDRNADGSSRSRYIATSWDTSDEVTVYATVSLGGSSGTSPLSLPETMRDVALSADGGRFLVSVDQTGVDSGRAKLYHGVVPPADDTTSILAPGDGGLTVLPINNLVGTEGIGGFEYSPDGAKVAAVVGSRTELRVYDIDSETIYAYELGSQNEIVVRNEMPEAATNIGVSRQPAIRVTSGGLIWSPDSTRIAFVRPEGVGTKSIYILDYASGDLAFVRAFENSTVPQIAWSSDGASLFVMSTKLSTYQTYGDSEFRRIQAAENGSDIGSGVAIERSRPEFLNWSTEPSNLVNVDDETLLFTWEGRLYRLIATGGELAGAPYVPLTVFHLIDRLVRRGVAVEYERPFASTSLDSVVFLVRDGNRTTIGERTFATAESCPEVVAPEAVDAEESPAEE